MNKELQDLLIKGMAKRQNKTAKLNAGQLREQAKAAVDTILQDLSPEQKLKVVKLLVK